MKYHMTQKNNKLLHNMKNNIHILKIINYKLIKIYL